MFHITLRKNNKIDTGFQKNKNSELNSLLFVYILLTKRIAFVD